MIEEETPATLDFGALREAIEKSDADALLGFCAENSELRVENAALPEGKTFELKGRGQIERHLRTVCAQPMTCLIEGGAVYGERSLAFVEACRYQDGSEISVHTMLEVSGGLIVRQRDVVESPFGVHGATS